jgi:tetratricopeptide (TPR) repeat protein
MARSAPRLMLFLAAFLPHLGSADTFTTHIERGDALYRNFDNEGALREYESAYLAAPTDFTVLARMIRIYNDQGRLQLYVDGGGRENSLKAVEYADRMLELYPERAETYFWLALAKGSTARFYGISEKARIGKSVEEYAIKAIELDSTYSHAYMILGIFYRMAGDLSWIEKLVARTVFGTDFEGTYEQSVEMLQKAIALDPANIYAYYELGRTFRSLEQNEDALKAYRTVLAMTAHSLREQKLQEEVEGRIKTELVTG